MHRLAAVVSVVLSLSCSAQELMDQLYKRADGAEMGIEEKYRRVKGAKAGQYLAKTYPGQRVLIFLPPEMLTMDGAKAAEPAYKATVDGFVLGLGEKLTIVGVVEPVLPAPVKAKLQAGMAAGMMVPQGPMWFDVPALNKELAPFKGKYDILVCLANLPGTDEMPGMPGASEQIGFEKLEFWLDEKVNLLLLEGGINQFGKLIQVGKIIGACAYKTNVSEDAYEKPPPQNLADAFGMRFVLITPGNLAQYMMYFTWPRP